MLKCRIFPKSIYNPGRPGTGSDLKDRKNIHKDFPRVLIYRREYGKTSDFTPIYGYISKTVEVRRNIAIYY